MSQGYPQNQFAVRTEIIEVTFWNIIDVTLGDTDMLENQFSLLVEILPCVVEIPQRAHLEATRKMRTSNKFI